MLYLQLFGTLKILSKYTTISHKKYIQLKMAGRLISFSIFVRSDYLQKKEMFTYLLKSTKRILRLPQWL